MNNITYISIYVVLKLSKKIIKNRKDRMRILVVIFDIENSNLKLGEFA